MQRYCPSSHYFNWFKVSLNLFDFEVRLLQFAHLRVLYFTVQETYLGWTKSAGLSDWLLADTVGEASFFFVSDTDARFRDLVVVIFRLWRRLRWTPQQLLNQVLILLLFILLLFPFLPGWWFFLSSLPLAL